MQYQFSLIYFTPTSLVPLVKPKIYAADSLGHCNMYHTALKLRHNTIPALFKRTSTVYSNVEPDSSLLQTGKHNNASVSLYVLIVQRFSQPLPLLSLQISFKAGQHHAKMADAKANKWDYLRPPSEFMWDNLAHVPLVILCYVSSVADAA